MADIRDQLFQEMERRRSQSLADESKLRDLADIQERIAINPDRQASISPTVGFIDHLTGTNSASFLKDEPDIRADLKSALAGRHMARSPGFSGLANKLESSGGSSKLRREWLSNPITKNTQKVSESFAKVSGAVKNPSAAGDISLVFGFMKMIDPGSTVREGEFATAAKAAGVPERIRNMYNKLKTGERLTPEQRQDFLNQSRVIYDEQLGRQAQVDNAFGSLADRTGANRQNVVLGEMFAGGAQGQQAQQPAQNSFSGQQLNQMSDEQLDQVLSGLEGL